MKRLLSLSALALLAAQAFSQITQPLPEVRYHQTRFLENNYWTIGDSVVTERELNLYFKMVDERAYRHYHMGMKLQRSRVPVGIVGVAGLAAGMFIDNPTVDRIGYGGLLLSGVVTLGLTLWSARKQGTGVYYYNHNRGWPKDRKWAPPVQETHPEQKPYSVIDTGK